MEHTRKTVASVEIGLKVLALKARAPKLILLVARITGPAERSRVAYGNINEAIYGHSYFAGGIVGVRVDHQVNPATKNAKYKINPISEDDSIVQNAVGDGRTVLVDHAIIRPIVPGT